MIADLEMGEICWGFLRLFPGVVDGGVVFGDLMLRMLYLSKVSCES